MRTLKKKRDSLVVGKLVEDPFRDPLEVRRSEFVGRIARHGVSRDLKSLWAERIRTAIRRGKVQESRNLNSLYLQNQNRQ